MNDAILILNRLDVEKVRYHKWLAEFDKDLLLVCDSKMYKQLKRQSPEVLDCYSEVVPVDDYEASGLVEYHAILMSQRYRIAGIIAISEVDILRAARLRDYFGLTQNNERAMNCFRDKVTMKKRAQSVGIETPNFLPVRNAIDLQLAREAIGFPMVLKPTLYGGSVGYSKISNAVELAASAKSLYLKPDVSNPLIAEAFVEGEMVHCDGIVSAQCEIEWAVTFKNVEGCLAYQSGAPNGGYKLPEADEIHGKCIDAISKFISDLDLEIGFAFHAEFFIEENSNRLLLCEIAARPGGSKIRQVLKMANDGLDTFELHALLQIQLESEAKAKLRDATSPACYLVLPPRYGVLKIQDIKPPEFLTNCSWAYHCASHDGAKLDNAKHSAEELASLLWIAEGQDLIESKIELAKTWLLQKHSIDVSGEVNGTYQ